MEKVVAVLLTNSAGSEASSRTVWRAVMEVAGTPGSETTRMAQEPASRWQAASQPSPERKLPSSHCSPAADWRKPSPQKASWQELVQRSPLLALPSSQTSSVSRTPSPQRWLRQSGRQVASGAREFSVPRSHCSMALEQVMVSSIWVSPQRSVASTSVPGAQSKLSQPQLPAWGVVATAAPVEPPQTTASARS